MVRWLERLTAERNIDGSRQTLVPKVGCSLSVHPAANRYLVAILRKLKVTRKGTGHPTSLCRRLRKSVLTNRHSPTYGIVYKTNLYQQDHYAVPVTLTNGDNRSNKRRIHGNQCDTTACFMEYQVRTQHL